MQFGYGLAGSAPAGAARIYRDIDPRHDAVRRAVAPMTSMAGASSRAGSDNGHYGAHGKVEGSDNPRLSLLGECRSQVVTDRWGCFSLEEDKGLGTKIRQEPGISRRSCTPCFYEAALDSIIAECRLIS